MYTPLREVVSQALLTCLQSIYNSSTDEVILLYRLNHAMPLSSELRDYLLYAMLLIQNTRTLKHLVQCHV